MKSPAQSANIFGHDNTIVQVIGSGVNVTVEGSRQYLNLTRYESQTKLGARDGSEIALLSAYRTDVVPLLGREREIDDLRQWLDSEANISVRVLVGAGGRGKTRLALELARAISNGRWLAGFATAKELDRFRGQNQIERWRWDKPVLIIFDYAASRAEQLRDWLRELVDASLEDRPRLRLLLLERQANRGFGWLETVVGSGDDANSRAAIAMLDPPEPVELSPISELEFRRKLFTSLLKTSKRSLVGLARGVDAEFDRALAEHKWAGDPLFLMMAGLAAARVGVREALSLSRADLALSIARRELDRIGRIGAAHGVDVKRNKPGTFVRHMGVMATLTQGLTLAEARSLAKSELAALDLSASLDATIEALMDALPTPDSDGGVAPILPDIIGEGAILAWLGPNRGLGPNGGDNQARIAGAARVALAKVSSTLVRTAQDFAAAGFAEPIHWLEALAGAPEIDVDALMEIADALPDHTLALRQLAVDLIERIVQSLRGPATAESNAGSNFQVQSQYATALNNLGIRMGEIGRREDAFAVTRQAVDVARPLAAKRPDLFLPALAMSLTNLSLRSSAIGQREDAFVAARAAADIYRDLAAEYPDAFLSTFAGSLSNLGKALTEVGRREDALKATQEGVEIGRRLVAERSDAYLGDLAVFLQNLGAQLFQLGRREEALAAAQEAVEIRRRKAAEQPDAFLPDFATSLQSLSSLLGELGRREEALRANEESLEIIRHLSEDLPETFRPELATTLNNLGPRLSELGLHEDALKAAREASDIFRGLAVDRPDAFLPDFAMSLDHLGTILSHVGLGDEALEAAHESTHIYRRLAAERPDFFLSDLARTLTNLGNHLRQLGQRERAHAASQEAVEILRRLAAERPDAFLPGLALSLFSLGPALSELGRRGDALVAAREAADIYRDLAAEYPEAFMPKLAASLNNVGVLLNYLGLHEDELAVKQEAVAIGRHLAVDRPDAFGPDLALWIHNLGEGLTALGRREGAFAAAREAMTLLAPFFVSRPRAYASGMALMYNRYLELSADLGVEPDAELLSPIVDTINKLQDPPDAGVSDGA
jgi:tetratricopeptide (TPR) repeat protein